MPSDVQVLLLPGLWNSGPEHWQSHWARERSDCARVEQDDWETPRCAEWVHRLDEAVGGVSGPVLLAAHSLACILVAHWAGARPDRAEQVRGALLVAPSDAEAPGFPVGPSGFTPIPAEPLPFRSTLVYSTADPFATVDRALEFARRWGSTPVSAGDADHLGSAARLGPWPFGQALLDGLIAGVGTSA